MRLDFEMDPSWADQPGSASLNVHSNYLNSLLSVNMSTPKPTSDYVVWQDPNTVLRIVEIVGIIAALAVSAMIIMGVAFVMSKLRKRHVQSESDTGAPEVQVDSNHVQQQMESSIPHYDIKHVYSISGIKWEVHTEKRTLKQFFMPKFLSRKPSNELPIVNEALKKDLGRIYVY